MVAFMTKSMLMDYSLTISCLPFFLYKFYYLFYPAINYNFHKLMSLNTCSFIHFLNSVYNTHTNSYMNNYNALYAGEMGGHLALSYLVESSQSSSIIVCAVSLIYLLNITQNI